MGRLICRVGFPMIANRIRQMYQITPENVALDMDRVTDAYERLDTLLENRRYLVGDRFSRADLTLAALAAPTWRPPEHSSIGHRISSIRTKSKPSGRVRQRPVPGNTSCVCIASTAYRSRTRAAPLLGPLPRRRSQLVILFFTVSLYPATEGPLYSIAAIRGGPFSSSCSWVGDAGAGFAPAHSLD